MTTMAAPRSKPKWPRAWLGGRPGSAGQPEGNLKQEGARRPVAVCTRLSRARVAEARWMDPTRRA